MANLATALKSEIARLARKELKADLDVLRKATAHYRSEIAALKRHIANLEKDLKGVSKQASRAAKAPEPTETSNLRFRADGFKAKREKLGLSAEATGKLFDVSGQTIYLWESKRTSPRANQMAKVAAFRKLGKKQVAAILEGMASKEAAADPAK